jgi:hypothetical protein
LELTGVNSKPRRVPEDDVSEGSTGYHAGFAPPRSSPEGEVVRLELEQQRPVSVAVQTERDHRIAQLADKLTLKSALLKQAEANAAEAAKRAGLELRQRLLMHMTIIYTSRCDLIYTTTLEGTPPTCIYRIVRGGGSPGTYFYGVGYVSSHHPSQAFGLPGYLDGYAFSLDRVLSLVLGGNSSHDKQGRK